MKHITKAPCAVLLLIVGVDLSTALLTGCDAGNQSIKSPEAARPTNATTSSSGPEAKYAGVYLCQSPATTLRLEADKSGGMMINGNAREGTWTVTHETNEQTTIEFKPDNAASSTFAVLSDGSLKEKKYGCAFEKLPAR